MKIPQGYKQTAVGIIPQEWEVKRLGACFSIGHGRDYKHLSNGDIPVYGSGGIICYVGSSLHDGETVCIGRKGTINKPFYYNGPIWTVDTLFYTHNFQSVLPRYVGYLFDSIDWMRYNEATGVPSLTAKTISNIKKAVPPMEEQRKIAEILGVWDEAIEKQSRLIDKLELRKRALMQRLLTGRTRLPGFTTPWQKVKLGEIFKERNETKCEHLPLLSITADRGVILQSESDKKDTSNDDKSKYKRICPNDIGYNTMRMWQGRSALSAMEGIVSPAYTIVTPKVEVDPLFISELIKQPRVVYDFWTHSQGLVGDTLNCKFHDFSQVKVAIPSHPEQKAIAEVLTAADNEIVTHRKKLDALRLQKRGLMQQLLTGKTRVKI